MTKHYRHIITVEVLSNEADLDFGDLQKLHHMITEGDCSGQYTVTKTEELDAEQMAKALEAQGSDPEFLLWDDEEDDGQYEEFVAQQAMRDARVAAAEHEDDE